jgi:hypothetical protein
VSGDDWQAGDLALCVKRGQWRHCRSGGISNAPWKSGGIYTVRRYGPCPTSGLPTLWFEGYPGERGADGGAAMRFRKIRPHVPDAEDRETIALLTGKPAKVRA